MMRGLSQSGASARRVKAPGVDLEVIRRIIVNALLETPADLDPWILTDLVQGHIVSALRDEVLDFDPLLGDLLEIDGVTEETLYVGIVNVATTLASLGIYMEEPSLTLSDSERRQILQVGRAARHSAIAAYELRRLRAAITRARRKRLGQMLVEGQFITNAQLEDALAAQKRNGRRLGTNLIEWVTSPPRRWRAFSAISSKFRA